MAPSSPTTGVLTITPRGAAGPVLRRLALILVAALLLVPGLTVLIPPSAQADDTGAPAEDPVRLVIATAGLAWEDISRVDTPSLQCLADVSGVGAMNTTSTTVVSTKRQGMETLRTGYRGLAEEAPRTAGIPSPPTDQWQQLDVPVVEIDAVGGGETPADVAQQVGEPVDRGVEGTATGDPLELDEAQLVGALLVLADDA